MAELEILQALVSFFCPTSEAASTCNEFIQNHSQVLPPIGPLFYFLLFPAVFTILFVLLLMDNVGVAKNRSWGIKVLLGITAFIFIIISGWYPIMLILSEFWYIIIILLGFLWFVTGHRDKKEGGGEGGGPSGKMSALGLGAMGSMGGLIKGRKEDLEEINTAERNVKLAKTLLTDVVEKKSQRPGDDVTSAEKMLGVVSTVIINYKYSGIYSSRVSHLERERDEINPLLDKAQKVARKSI